MIDRQSSGLFPDKPHTACRAPDGKLLYEEMLTRGGFAGPFTYLYHRFPVAAHRDVAVTKRGWPRPHADPRATLRATGPSGGVSTCRTAFRRAAWSSTAAFPFSSTRT